MKDEYDTNPRKKRKDEDTYLPDYTEEELEYRAKLIAKMEIARNENDSPHEEFDGMTRPLYYDTNKRADLSYIPPKSNKVEKRIVTGYTREKDNTLLSALLSYNYEPFIQSYDDSQMLFPELGNSMKDLVKKTRSDEGYDTLRPIIYRELIAQGIVFVEEIWNIQRIPNVDNKGSWKPGDTIKDASFNTDVMPHIIERAEVRLIPGKQVFLGKFHEEDYKKQGLIFTYEVFDRPLAQSVYGKWDRWDCVPFSVDLLTLNTTGAGTTYGDWDLYVQKGQVGVLKVQCPFDNRYMIFLNGVMMLPIDFPLTEITPFVGTPSIVSRVLENIGGCAFGKGQPAKTKVDQAVSDEFLRLIILGMQQGRTPTMGSRGKVMTKDIYTPGKILQNIKENQLFPILPESTRLNNADFSAFQLIKTMIDEKTINATFAGQDQGGAKTATQILQEKQQQLLKLGLNFDAIKGLEADLVWKRIGNIILNFPRAIKKQADTEKGIIENIYRSFSVETTFDDGKSGLKVYEFTDKDFPDIRKQQEEEKSLEEYYGKPTKKVYFNTNTFIHLLKYRWNVQIVPSQETNDMIEKEMFINDIRTAKELFPMQVNDEYAKEKFALKIKQDPDKFFIANQGILDPMAQALQNQNQGMQQAPPVVGQEGIGKQLQNQMM